MAIMLAAVGLFFATVRGAGAVSRLDMGLVIACGLAIGTLFTLFVVPAIHLLIATDHSRQAAAQASPPGEAVGAVRG